MLELSQYPTVATHQTIQTDKHSLHSGAFHAASRKVWKLELCGVYTQGEEPRTRVHTLLLGWTCWSYEGNGKRVKRGGDACLQGFTVVGGGWGLGACGLEGVIGGNFVPASSISGDNRLTELE